MIDYTFNVIWLKKGHQGLQFSTKQSLLVHHLFLGQYSILKERKKSRAFNLQNEIGHFSQTILIKD